MRLEYLAQTRTGLVTKRKAATKSSFEKIKYKQITLKSIISSGYIDCDLLEEFISCERLKNDYIARKDDIIVRLSHPYTAVLVDEKSAGCVVPSHFVIIRCDNSKIIPAYLYWLLNTQEIKNQIANATGVTGLGTIKPSYFNSIEIFDISIENQYKISEINRLQKKESQLLMELSKEKEKYHTWAIKKIQKEMRTKK